MGSMRVLLLVLDGVADRPSGKLRGKTPLQAANSTTLNKLASEGITGMMDPVAPGIPVGSDTGHLALLGYDPRVYYTGRGPFEALGAGIDLRPSDIAFRCNFATVAEDWTVIDRRAGRISGEEAAGLAESVAEVAESLSSEADIIFRHTVEHRGVLVLRGDGLSDRVIDVDPHREGVRARMPEPTDSTAESMRTSQLLREFLEKTRKRLEIHPINTSRASRGLRVANAILPRGGGRMPNLPSINDRFGIKGAVVAGGALYKGVCRAAGLEVVEAPGATGTINTDLPSKFSKASDCLKKYDFVLLHIKGTDSASHDKDPSLKAEFIRRIDKVLGEFSSELSDSTIICVTSDHTTSSTLGMHRGDPVPLLIKGEGVRRDDVVRFDEVSCARGGLARIRGVDLINILLDLANITEMYGE